MRLFSWLRERVGADALAQSARPPRSKSRQASRFRPRLESMEDRYVPSTLLVTRGDDDVTQKHTLRYEVAHAQNGDTILLTGYVEQSGITLTQGELVLTQRNLTIETKAGKPPVTISGGGISRIFEVAAGAQITLSNLTITGGNGLADNPAGDASQDGSGGGIVVEAAATLTVRDSTLSNNTALRGNGNGGGIFNRGTLTVGGSTLSGNSSTNFYGGGGGGIYNGGTLTVSASTLSGNSALYSIGGGIFNGGTATVSGSTLSGNSASYEGGGIFNEGTLTASGSTVSGNSVSRDGFGGGIFNDGTLTVSGSILSGNFAYGGAGIYNAGTATVSGSTLSSDSAEFGGGLYNNYTGILTVSGSTLSGNGTSNGFGGGIFNAGGTMTVSGSTLSGNFAGIGGGIFNASMLTVSGSTLSGNSASYEGGGIFNSAYGGTATISGSTLSGNSAGVAGGGVYNEIVTFPFYPPFPYVLTGTLTVSNSSTICGNSAPIGFGADVFNAGVLYQDSSSTIYILNGNPAVPI